MSAMTDKASGGFFLVGGDEYPSRPLWVRLGQLFSFVFGDELVTISPQRFPSASPELT